MESFLHVSVVAMSTDAVRVVDVMTDAVDAGNPSNGQSTVPPTLIFTARGKWLGQAWQCDRLRL